MNTTVPKSQQDLFWQAKYSLKEKKKRYFYSREHTPLSSMDFILKNQSENVKQLTTHTPNLHKILKLLKNTVSVLHFSFLQLSFIISPILSKL